MIKGLRITLPKLSATAVSVLFLGNVATAYAAEHSVSGSVTTNGIKGTMAHIHIGAMSEACAVAIPQAKSAAHKEGEIRGQIKP